jgi:hypothetical protein
LRDNTASLLLLRIVVVVASRRARPAVFRKYDIDKTGTVSIDELPTCLMEVQIPSPNVRRFSKGFGLFRSLV